MLKQLLSFYRRRIFIPVGRDALVLDVGSGDKPHWRSDVLLDKYISDRFSVQRSGNEKTVINKPIFDADAISMPFKNKVFDFVICSHLLEHVERPDLVINEIMRVGKAGYIELPYEGSSKIWDFPAHLWYCRQENGRLIFTAKQNIYFDKEIDKFVGSKKINGAIRSLLNKYFDNCIISLYWHDRIDCNVIGTPNLGLSLEVNKAKYSRSIFLLRNILNLFFSTFLFYKKRKEKIRLNDLVKEEFYGRENEMLYKKIYKFN